MGVKTKKWAPNKGKAKARNLLQLRAFMAERAGFEPAWDCSQTDFESAPL